MMGEEMTIKEFLYKLETGSGDDVLDLVSKFQAGGLSFSDFDYYVGESDDD